MNALIKLLDIRKSETKLVGLLLLHAFFNGIGIALCFTAANLIFLDNYGVARLPFAYTITAGILLVSGFVYSRYETKVKPSRFFRFVLIGCSLLMLANWFSFLSLNPLVMAFVLFISYWIIYQLTNLEFWGVAALVFNLRQSKRIFSLLGSGETIAKILGYLISPIIISYYSNTALILLAGIGFLFSSLIIWNLTASKKDYLHEKKDHDEHHQHQEMSILAILNVLRKDTFLFWTSMLAMVALFVYFTITYAFLDGVQHTIHENSEMAYLFGFLFGFGKLMNFLLKTFLSNRLIRNLGVKKVLLLLPVSLLIINALGVFGQLFGPGGEFFLWLFGLNMFFDELARSSLLKPFFLVLFQPLHNHRRLQGHTLAKGIMEPVGMGLAGIVLMILVRTSGLDLKLVSIYLTATVLIWIVVSLRVSKEYVKVVHSSLSMRWLVKTEVDISDYASKKLLLQSLESGEPIKVIYAMELLGLDHVHDCEKHISFLLQSDISEAQIKGLQFVQELQDTQFNELVLALIDSDNRQIKKEAFLTYFIVNEEAAAEVIAPYLDSEQEDNRKYALAYILKYGGIYAATLHGRRLIDLLENSSVDAMQDAAEIIGLIGAHNYYFPLIELLKQENMEVRKAAIQAAGETRNVRMLPFILEHIEDIGLFVSSSKALLKMGSSIFHDVSLKELKGLKLKLFLKACGDIESKESMRFLFKKLSYPDQDIARQASYSLESLGFKIDKNELSIVHTHLRLSVFQMMALMQIKSLMHFDLVHSAVENEINLIQQDVLRVLGFYYNRSVLNQIKDTLEKGNHESLANALERIELLVGKSFREEVLMIFEMPDYSSQRKDIRKKYGVSDNPVEMLRGILVGDLALSSYCRAIIIHHISAEWEDCLSNEVIEEYLTHDSALLREEIVGFIHTYRSEDFVNSLLIDEVLKVSKSSLKLLTTKKHATN